MASGCAYPLPEGVTEEQVMVEYFSATRWDGAVDLSWYNGTDTEFTLTTPAQLAGVAELVNSNAADFTGKTIRPGADISLLRYVEPGKPWWDGITGMAETGTTIRDCVNFGVVTGSGTSNGAGGIIGKLTGANLLRCANYGGVALTQSWHTGGTALTWASGTGTLEEVAAKAENSGSIRFCYGISADQYGSAAGKRLVSGVTSATLTACAHTGKTAQVPEVPATCTETGLTAIDWSQSVSDIDKQHYEKYGLKQEEMDYIESTIKPME